MRIEIIVPTKNRYANLALLIWSLIDQTYKNWDLTIVDDSELPYGYGDKSNRRDIRELSYILPMLKKMDLDGNQWRVEFGDRKGPHYCHQLGLEQSRNPYIYRVDDDCILDREALETLVTAWKGQTSKVGAIGPVVLEPAVPKEYQFLPMGFRSFKRYQGKVDEYGWTAGEHQWIRHPDNELQKVEHLYSSFLYSKEAADDIGGYELGYNVVGHREETDFTYRLFKKGYSLYVEPKALVWHLRNPEGGIRTYNDPRLWDECHNFFINKFGFKEGKNKDHVIKIFGGMGDVLCATPMIRGLRKIGKKIVISTTYPFLLQGNENIDELILAPDEALYEKIDFRHLYEWAFKVNFQGRISEAWCKLFDVEYDGDKLDYTIFQKERDWAIKEVGLDKFILISVSGGIPVVQFTGTEEVGAAGKVTALRDWDKEQWERLVKKVQKIGIKVYQVGGIKDEKIDSCNRHFLGTNYRLSVALLEQSAGFVSIDTFLPHAANAIGKRGVVLFGPANPKRSGHESNINIFYPAACQARKCWIGNESVGGKKSPWWFMGNYSCKSKECMNIITVEKVFKEVKRLLNGKY